MNTRPCLRSHVRPLQRGPGSLQLGIAPGAGVILDGLSDAEIALLEGLDGSADMQMLYAAAAVAGVAASRLSALIAVLDERHLLVESATDRARLSPLVEPGGLRLREGAGALATAYGLTGDGYDHVAARSTQHVVISGEGDLPFALADLLRVGGIGRVSVGTNAINALDLELRSHRPGSSGRTAWSRAPSLALAGSGSVGVLPGLPDLVVLAAIGAISPEAGEPWLRRGIPHLPVVVQGHRVQVGPLVVGGGDGPCLSCLDLHRCDRDAAWPALLSQLTARGPLRPSAPVNLEGTLGAMTIGAAAMIVHTCLDGQPVCEGLSLELSLPWPTVQTRRWITHPMCDCTPGHETMTA